MINNANKNTNKEEIPSDNIPVGIAKQMTKAYRESQITPRGTFTESAWFPAIQIEQIVKKIKKNGGDGLRIYFGRYTEEIIAEINKLPYGHKVPEKYKDMNTVLFVITKIIDGKQKTDYFIEKKNTGRKTVGGSTDPENRGELCPPDCTIESSILSI